MHQIILNYYYLFCVLLIFEITGLDISLYKSLICYQNVTQIENLEPNVIRELLFTTLILIDVLALILYSFELVKRKNFITIELCVLVFYMTLRFTLVPQYAPELYQMENYISLIRTYLTIIFLLISFLTSCTLKKFANKPSTIMNL
ncbi:hypothetical protein BpHYR1_002185 [Brachionus plicatilis]|uniref:Uncharacterized protein n=1 Tax=Brachionus plicatilis TaxID=10195 RepID=A0A3M7QAJ3_BRAPC|nr:hypothetical protein BpHYR1_002185 [Brachionus plicatilis]